MIISIKSITKLEQLTIRRKILGWNTMVLKREDDDKCNNGIGCLSLLLQTLVATSQKKKKKKKKRKEKGIKRSSILGQ